MKPIKLLPKNISLFTAKILKAIWAPKSELDKGCNFKLPSEKTVLTVAAVKAGKEVCSLSLMTAAINWLLLLLFENLPAKSSLTFER